MKKLKRKISEFLHHARGEIAYGLRMLCGRPTPMKRFIAVLIIGGALAAANIYLVVSSIYDMGVSDAKKEFMLLQHIEAIELQKQNDSINILNQRKYEYE